MDKNYFTNKNILEILDLYKPIAGLESASELLFWDSETYMPKGAAEDRGFVVGQLAAISQEKLLEPKLKKLVKETDSSTLNDYEKAVLRVLKKAIKIQEKIPAEFIKEFTKLTSESHHIWAEAKEKNNFKLFAPNLEKIIELTKKRIDYLGFEDHPYDTLIDDFEEGWTVKDCDAYFNAIKTPLTELLNKIKGSAKFNAPCSLKNEPYQKADIQKLQDFILDFLKFDKSRMRLDTSAHPFEIAISPNDVRMTTRYKEADFKESVTSVMHEFGHTIYEAKGSEQLSFTPLQHGASMASHESQSRLWENIIGKHPVILEKIYIEAKKYLPFMQKYSFEDFSLYFNEVQPGFIRVEADEVTYHFHIMLRYEIEKMIFENKVKVVDLPELWNTKMNEYLGVVPKMDSLGVLQDIHWSAGYFGYFPTYSLGTFMSGMWAKNLEKSLGSFDKILGNNNSIPEIQAWLQENMHQFGQTYTSKELIRQATNADFTTKPFLDYLEKKYSKVYDF